jgi:molecular chaperone DnaK (HSP70)
MTMSDRETIVGIDLGTTNSEIAAFTGGRVEVLGPGSKMLPSCVGLAPNGQLLVGEAARNQQLLYPDRTVRSVKRKMGSLESVTLGEKTLTPQEVSALILRELGEWGRRQLGQPVRKAVITVPAYFSDAQRQATREAGALAGLEVVRIVNEPTAASLAYGLGDGGKRTVMIYDLGGGTFDVSLVTIEGEVTEVLASHGNNRLGGDDFDDLLLNLLLDEFREEHGVDLRQDHAAARSRLWWAAEEAKKKLSFEPYARVREEGLVNNGTALHLDLELSREQYEELIRPLVESTLDSVSRTLADAGKSPGDVEAILLVGGSTRTPLISRLLQEKMGIEPRTDVHPDLCVALGAGILASRLAGEEVNRVLVDVSPFSFGISFLGERGGAAYPYCYKPIVRRNTPLPVTRTEPYATVAPYQTQVKLEVFQGDDDDALKNILVGEFTIQGLRPRYEPNEVLCRMNLNVDGILSVTAIEKETGKSRHITIANALQPKSAQEIAAARERLQQLFAQRAAEEQEWASDDDGASDDASGEELAEEMPPAAEIGESQQRALTLVERARRRLDSMHADDREEVIDLEEKVQAALASGDAAELDAASRQLEELLFFVEGR